MTNYSKGASFERKIKKQLEEEGCFCVRSAGSHGPVDLVCINETKEVLFIQCKLSGVISKADKDSLATLAKTYGARAFVVEKRKREVIWLEL